MEDKSDPANWKTTREELWTSPQPQSPSRFTTGLKPRSRSLSNTRTQSWSRSPPPTPFPSPFPSRTLSRSASRTLFRTPSPSSSRSHSNSPSRSPPRSPSPSKSNFNFEEKSEEEDTEIVEKRNFLKYKRKDWTVVSTVYDSGLLHPNGVTFDKEGNMLIVDKGHHRILKVFRGKVNVLAGKFKNFNDGDCTLASFNNPYFVAVDSKGNSIITDCGNHRIRKITPNGEVLTIAGSERGFSDGEGSQALFASPYNLCIDSEDNIFVTDHGNHLIRKISPSGKVTVLAGSERGYEDNIDPKKAKFNSPYGIAIDSEKNLIISDCYNHKIRKISPSGAVSTIAGGNFGFRDGNGTSAQLNWPTGVAIDLSDNIYFADFGNHAIRQILKNGDVVTIAGNGNSGFCDGEGSEAKFQYPCCVYVDFQRKIYISDRMNNRIRVITFKSDILSREWPKSHRNLSEECQKSILAFFSVNQCMVLPFELKTEIIRIFIKIWPDYLPNLFTDNF